MKFSTLLSRSTLLLSAVAFGGPTFLGGCASSSTATVSPTPVASVPPQTVHQPGEDYERFVHAKSEPYAGHFKLTVLSTSEASKKPDIAGAMQISSDLTVRLEMQDVKGKIIVQGKVEQGPTLTVTRCTVYGKDVKPADCPIQFSKADADFKIRLSGPYVDAFKKANPDTELDLERISNFIKINPGGGEMKTDGP